MTTRDEVIAMAETAGFSEGLAMRASTRAVEKCFKAWPEEIERFAALAIAKDRERLAADVELPEAVHHEMDGDVCVGYFSFQQLRDYGDRRAAAEREACAGVAKAISDKYAYGYYGQEVDTADEIEAAIRARGDQL